MTDTELVMMYKYVNNRLSLFLKYSYIKSGNDVFVKALPLEVRNSRWNYNYKQYRYVNVVGFNNDSFCFVALDDNDKPLIIGGANYGEGVNLNYYIIKTNDENRKRIIQSAIIPVEDDKIKISRLLMQLIS